MVPGNRVTLALGNSLEYVVAAFAVLKTGAILNPVNPALGTDELGYVLGHAAPRLVVTDEASDEKLRGLGQRTVLGTSLGTAAADGPLGVTIGPDDYSTLLYTSGTTGRPKGVLFTHGRTGTSGPHFIEALGLTGDDHPGRDAALPRQRLGGGGDGVARGRHGGVPEELLGLRLLGPGARHRHDGALYARHRAGHAADARPVTAGAIASAPCHPAPPQRADARPPGGGLRH